MGAGSGFGTLGGGGGVAGVSSVNSLVGAVIFAAGTNITLTPVGNTITIDATGGTTLTADELDAINGANLPSATNVFATINDLISAGINQLDPVISQTNTPPGSPATGDRYLVGTSPTGAWAFNANDIAEWNGASWSYTTPVLDDVVYITTTLTTLRFDAISWVPYPGSAILQNGNSFGAAGVRIGTNDANPLWLKHNNIIRFRMGGSDIRMSDSLHVGATGLSAAAGARLHVRGAGTTDATYAIKVDDNALANIFYLTDAGHMKVLANANNYIEWNGAIGGLFTAHTSTATISGFKAVNSASSVELRCGNGQEQLLFSDYFDIYPGGSGSPIHRFNSSGLVGFGTGANAIGARVDISGTTSDSSAFGLRVADVTNTAVNFSVRNDGKIFTTGNFIDLIQLGFSNYCIGVDGGGYVTYSSSTGGNGHRFGRYNGTTFTEIARIEVASGTDNLFFIKSLSGQTNGVVQVQKSGGNTAFAVYGETGQVAINSNTVDASALLELASTTLGFLPPRMTTTQKNAISSPAAGLVVYDTTLNKLCVYTTAWETITSV